MKIFSDGFRHRIKWDTKLGATSRKFATWIALTFIRLGRGLLKWSVGRCSWCGENPGFASTVSKKGLRCDSIERKCVDMPDNPHK